MRNIYLASFFVFAATAANAQSPFWTENFGTGCFRGQLVTQFMSVNGTWTQTLTGTNDAYADLWFVSATASGTGGQNCSDFCITNSRSLHIGNAAIPLVGFGADTGSTYLTGVFCGANICSTTDKRVESPVINCFGQSNIAVSFTYYEGGEGADDDATMLYSPDGGITWTLLDPLAKTAVGPCTLPASSWVEYSVNLPSSANNNGNVKIGFRWTNDNDGQGADPSFAVDDIALISGISSGTADILAASVNVYADANGALVVDAPGKTVLLNEVTDVLGRTINAQLQNGRITLEASATGVYSVRLLVNGTPVVKKVVVR